MRAEGAPVSMYNRGLVVVCKTYGFPYNHEKNQHKLQDKDSIPNGCLGYLRNVLQVKQICAHPRCLQIEEFVFQLDSLVKMVDAELEALGYTQKYHEHMTKGKHSCDTAFTLPSWVFPFSMESLIVLSASASIVLKRVLDALFRSEYGNLHEPCAGVY